MMSHCPFCERPFSKLDQQLLEHDSRYQCRHCWNSVHKAGKPQRAANRLQMPKVRVVRPRHEKRAA